MLFERFAPCSEIVCSLCSGLFLVLKFSSLFRALCSLFSNSRILFEFSNSASFLERLARCFQTLWFLPSGLFLLWSSRVLLERFASRVVKISSRFRAVSLSLRFMSLYSLVPSALDPQTQDAKNNLVRPTRLVFASAKILVLSALNPQNQSVKKKSVVWPISFFASLKIRVFLLP